MLIKELVEKIDVKGTPIIYHETILDGRGICYAITTTPEKIALLRNQPIRNSPGQELGVHLTNVEVQQFYDYYLSTNSPAVKIIQDMLAENFGTIKDKEAFAYVLFSILHEVGHWQHLVRSGLSRIDYRKRYEANRDELTRQFNALYYASKNDKTKEMVKAFFNIQYRKLPTEVLQMSTQSKSFLNILT